jgi:hypothetical protein
MDKGENMAKNKKTKLIKHTSYDFEYDKEGKQFKLITIHTENDQVVKIEKENIGDGVPLALFKAKELIVNKIMSLDLSPPKKTQENGGNK